MCVKKRRNSITLPTVQLQYSTTVDTNRLYTDRKNQHEDGHDRAAHHAAVLFNLPGLLLVFDDVPLSLTGGDGTRSLAPRGVRPMWLPHYYW